MKPVHVERIAPYFLAFSGVFLWHSSGLVFPKGDAILGASLTLGAILTGFLATAKSILMVVNNELMARLREAGYIEDLASYLRQAIWLSFSFCIFCMVGYFISTNVCWYGYFWIFLGVASAGAFIRVVNIMLKIMQS